MKKKSIILSIFALFFCLTILFNMNAPRNEQPPAKELCYADEFVVYDIEEDNDENTNEEEHTLETPEENETEGNNEEENQCETCVCVIGKAKLTITPDMATITACIEKFNEDINLSKNENLEILNKIMSALKEQGISEEKISLDYFTAHPSYDYSVSHKPVGYYSKSCFSFEVENLDNIPTYISSLTENGVTNICDICYSLSNLEEVYNNALTQAVENAKTKASQLLNNENLQICGIREESIYSSSSLCREYVENLSSSLMGNVEIEARVNVMFKVA